VWLLTVVVRHFKKNSLRFSVYHGAQRQKRNAALLSNFDVVLTTYDTIRAEHVQADSPSEDAQGVIHSVIWHRIVLDEGTWRVMRDDTSNGLDGGSLLSAFRSPHDPKQVFEEGPGRVCSPCAASLVFDRHTNPEPLGRPGISRRVFARGSFRQPERISEVLSGPYRPTGEQGMGTFKGFGPLRESSASRLRSWLPARFSWMMERKRRTAW
jgi:hypothetical protein